LNQISISITVRIYFARTAHPFNGWT